ncbi:two-component sensor histidine kinase [Kibdelosporangium aridum]|uniref:histidine kinase n=1 Tax=Kibdelosporangium aridum TaxID=2030 RepID=A0A428ZDU2_KIBAR|nr:histidine kinase [Kibdelosporangium aridum]RSM86252.1 two-component sensor histidine kinase [Kibdelosporangium aridum]
MGTSTAGKRVHVLREAGVYLGTLGVLVLVEGVLRQWFALAALVALGVVALAIRRRWPLVAAALPVVASAWVGAEVLLVVLCFGAGYRVASRRHLCAWLAGYLGAAGAIVLVRWQLGAPQPWAVVVEQALTLAFAVVVPGLVGHYLAQQRALVAERAVLRERARIAADMHDSLGHQLTLISVQAASLEVDPALSDAQREASRIVGATARTAIDELRAAVMTMRDPNGTNSQALPRRSINELVEHARAAGMRITLVRDGDEQQLSALTQHALYRVVQESLTNAHKHAPGSAVTVTLRYEPGTLLAEIRNPLSVRLTGPGGRQGIVGMRERVRLIGGLLRAGPDGPDYRIAAILPC